MRDVLTWLVFLAAYMRAGLATLVLQVEGGTGANQLLRINSCTISKRLFCAAYMRAVLPCDQVPRLVHFAGPTKATR